MTPEQFAFWLHGFFELSGDSPTITKAQAKMISEHLDLVFTKVTPPLNEKKQTLEELVRSLGPHADPKVYCTPGKIC
jgi:hypothetical protein